MLKYTLPALLLAGWTGMAIAQTFEEVDADGDGVISAEEAQAWGIDLEAADQAGDGVISREEFDAYMQTREDEMETYD